ncbi:MAG: polyphosphate polymerase domain-containing protein [Acholeplasmataceae bacterium]|nr:polyphosphate polymerase domain-containing protein [Acholeplasmataceae bacterium]
MKQIINRYERKYLITERQKNDLIGFLKDYLVEDPYSLEKKAYTIYNVYYDTFDHAIIRNSISKPVYKEKLRLRCYKFPLDQEDYVYLEIKKKYQGVVNKRRLSLSFKQAINYIENHEKPQLKDDLDRQIFDEIDYFIKVHKAKPGAFISYDRIAMSLPNHTIRITFDHHIQFCKQQDFLSKQELHPILQDENLWLMEIKSENNFPLWLVNKLSSFELFGQSFSKYGIAYQQYLIGGVYDDHLLY